MAEVDITVIGAGVVGLAVAAAVAGRGRKVYVLEKNDGFGRETSSRNSQVVHAGLYYPPGSLKARACLEGNRLLYEICRQNDIAHKNLTKIIVANGEAEEKKLEFLRINGERNGVGGLRLLSRAELNKLEPNVKATAALFVPSTGIIDSHGLMKYFWQKARDNGAGVVYKTQVTGIDRTGGGYAVEVLEPGGCFTFTTEVLINCAGLYSDKIAGMAGIDVEQAGYRLHYCKGEYFSVGAGKSGLVSRLVYPVPLPEVTGVGIHVTLDLDGRMRLGPGVKYVRQVDYTVDEANRRLFYEGVRRFLPAIAVEDLEPEMAGVRPKLQGPGEAQKDFVIRHEAGRGLPGLINLIGIESPGLTASPAIAEIVKDMVL
ncbi:MAG: NAD(P)/FAD-dependent oxidoreductase [Peptococcaceae bacterium]|nr:MAG: NAD(P)/FAD-dependent oxidoreductase [Peptococcaceae bacterium]